MKKKNPRGFALAHLRRKLIRPEACGKCPKTIVIVGYI